MYKILLTVRLIAIASVAAVMAIVGITSGCSSSSSSSSSTSSSTRAIDANTTYVKTVSTSYDGTAASCSQVSRDTSSCQSAREALGLSGNWLDFSCNVVIGCANSSKVAMSTCSGATYVTLSTEDLPDYTSNYWPTSGSYDFSANGYTVEGTFDSLYAAFSTAFHDPNTIGAHSNAKMYVPMNPTQCSSSCTAGSGSSNAMGMGTVGMAINGVFIYDSVAGNTDNIFAEGGSFDQCGGHPDTSSSYHYHSEPYSISYNDDNLIGVMMDGFFIYGRNDNSAYSADYTSSSLITEPGSISNAYADNNGDGKTGTASTLYVYGGHSGVPPTGGSSVFHYHVTEWEGCYDESGSTKESDDGETDDSYNTPSGVCNVSGNAYWADTWFLTGHGNGGAYETLPTGFSTGHQSPSQETAAVRYYYGNPGTCSNCP